MSLRVLVANGWAKYTGLSIPGDSGTTTMCGLIYRPASAVWTFFSPTLILGYSSGSRAVPYEDLAMYGGTWQVESDGNGGYDSGISTALPGDTWVPFVYHRAGPHTGSYSDITLKIGGSSYTRNAVGSGLGTTYDRLMILNETDNSRGYDAARIMNFGITIGLTWAQAQVQYTDCQTKTVDAWTNPVTAGWLWSTTSARTVGSGGTYQATNMVFDATGDPSLGGAGPPPVTAMDFPNSPADGATYTAPNGTVYIYSTAKGLWSVRTATVGYFLPLAGGTMTGDIVLAADANSAMEPTTKQQVDAAQKAVMSAEDNLIVNGGFDIWQRGTSASGSGAAAFKGADRWNVWPDTGATVAVSLTVAAPLSDSFRCWMNINRSVAGSGTTQIYNRIEDVRTAAGQTVTLSFDIYATIAGSSYSVYLQQNFGSGGSPSASASSNSVSFSTAGTGWEHKMLTFSMPSIAGKTVGTNSNDFIQVLINFPSALGATAWAITNVDLRIGSVAPAQFLRRPYQQELALCQRYFQKLNGLFLSGYAGAGGTVYADTTYAVQMRASPTGAFSSISYTNASSLAVNFASIGHTRSSLTATAAGVALAIADLTVDAEL